MVERQLKPFVLAFVLSVVATTTIAATPTDDHWIGTWAASPDAAGPAFKAQTVREVIRMSVGGTRLRIRLSNLYGNGPITLGPVHIAAQADGSTTQPGSDHILLFGGKPTVILGKGDSVLSDPLQMPIKPLSAGSVSIYVGDTNGPSTIHGAGLATAYIIDGDATATRVWPQAEVNNSRFFITDVEVTASSDARAIVTFGDSITDGANSTPNTNRRWPDVLASRLQADPRLSMLGVVNAGIGGNRVLNDGVGMSALTRFERDALSKPHAHWIIVLEGINDIGRAGAATMAQDNVSAQQMIDGLKVLIARAHANGMKIYGATLTPFGGMQWPYHTAAGEQKRQAINAWIRQSRAFDAVIDFDKVVRDPAHPDRFLPAFDSGDHLHPSDAGYKAMADSVDLRLFASGP